MERKCTMAWTWNCVVKETTRTYYSFIYLSFISSSTLFDGALSQSPFISHFLLLSLQSISLLPPVFLSSPLNSSPLPPSLPVACPVCLVCTNFVLKLAHESVEFYLGIAYVSSNVIQREDNCGCCLRSLRLVLCYHILSELS